jgi:hypothetical protein
MRKARAAIQIRPRKRAQLVPARLSGVEWTIEVAMEYVITTTWDSEASVWVATSEDVPGLALESGSLDALMERVRFAVPELLSLNGKAEGDIPLLFKSERHDLVHA